MKDLAVVIVTWNNAAVIENALESLIEDLQLSMLDSEVWVVDSHSTDSTIDIVSSLFPAVKLLECPENLGFARANNLALRELGLAREDAGPDSPKAVYLLNPDTVTRRGATCKLYETLFADQRTGMVGARLTYADGSFQHSAFMFPGLRQIWAEFFPTAGRLIEGEFNGRYAKLLYGGDAPFPVDFTLGATMMVRSEALSEVGLLDEQFFMYCEEIDWAWRIRRAGWEILCEPRSHVTHLGGGSSSQARPRSILNLWKSRLLLIDKYYAGWKRAIARRLIVQGLRRQLAKLPADESELLDVHRELIELASL